MLNSRDSRDHGRRPTRSILSFPVDRIPASPRVVYWRKLDNRQELLDELRQVIAHPSDVLHRRTIAPRRKQYTMRIMATVLYILTLITLAIERRCLLLHYTARIFSVRFKNINPVLQVYID